MDKAVYADGKWELVRDYSERLKALMAEMDAEEEARLAGKADPEELERLYRAFDIYEREQARPHAVDPQCAEVFDALVADCNQLMQEFDGKLTAVVNEKTHEAHITMECIYAEFKVGEFMPLLRAMAAGALSVMFMPTNDDLLRVSIDMPYFFVIEDAGEA